MFMQTNILTNLQANNTELVRPVPDKCNTGKYITVMTFNFSMRTTICKMT